MYFLGYVDEVKTVLFSATKEEMTQVLEKYIACRLEPLNKQLSGNCKEKEILPNSTLQVLKFQNILSGPNKKIY